MRAKKFRANQQARPIVYYMGQRQFLFHIRHYMYLKWSRVSFDDVAVPVEQRDLNIQSNSQPDNEDDEDVEFS